MGHVPPRPFPFLGEGPYFPGRQHRRSRPAGASSLATGRSGEDLACAYLSSKGLTILRRNLRVGRGEIDLIAKQGSTAIVFEVRSLAGSNHPLDAVDEAKRRQVRSLAQQIRIARCDLLGIGVTPGHLVVHWDKCAF